MESGELPPWLPARVVAAELHPLETGRSAVAVAMVMDCRTGFLS